LASSLRRLVRSNRARLAFFTMSSAAFGCHPQSAYRWKLHFMVDSIPSALARYPSWFVTFAHGSLCDSGGPGFSGV